MAIDAERASGYRYGQRAYLVQMRREGVGHLAHRPHRLPDLSPVGEAIGDAEWILHAATQDLPCLAEVGLRPQSLFDTELGGRLLGLPRVGLGAMVEHYLGFQLAKEHSAVDWSMRPLPEPWLLYAALDVEVLVDLRDAVAAELASQGKTAWAAEEFEHLLDFTGPAEPRVDPWRRTSGMHKVRGRRGRGHRARAVAVARRHRPAARHLPRAGPARRRDQRDRHRQPARRPSRRAPWVRRAAARTVGAASPGGDRRGRRRALALPEADLPVLALPPSGPPPPKAWADRDPVAAARLARARELLGAVSAELAVPVENLLTPDLLRRFLWDGSGRSDDGRGRRGARRDGRPALADDDHRAAHLARCSEHPPA